MWLIIGLSGVTCGGKSTLARALKTTFPDSHLLCQDNFFLPVDSKHHTWIPELNHINWEIITSVDMEKMWKTITDILTEALPSSESSRVSSFVESGTSGCTAATNSKIFIKDNAHRDNCVDLSKNELYEQITGDLAPEMKSMNKECTIEKNYQPIEKAQNDRFPNKPIKILIIEGFLILNYRRIADICQLKYHLTLTKEQCRERRNKRTYDPPDVPGFFELYIWPKYEKHRDEVLQDVRNVKVIDGNGNFDVIVQGVVEDIKNVIIKWNSKEAL